MKFTIEPQHGIKQDSVIVWDAEKGQELCTFTGCEFETEDEYIIDKLVELGYGSGQSEPDEDEPATDGIIPDGEEVILGDNEEPEQVVTLNDDDAVIESALRAKAKALGITHTHVKGIEKLTAEIAEKEGGTQ